MRVLVTGATGLIGSAVCDALLARGDEVVGLSRDPARARSDQPDRLLARLGSRQRAPARGRLRGRRRGRQPDRREDQPAAHRRGQAADPRQPRAGDQEPRRRDARRRRRRRRRWSASARSATTATTARRSSTSRRRPPTDWVGQMCADWEGRRARRRAAAACASRCCASAPVLDPDGGLLKQLLLPFKLGARRAARRRRQYMPWIHRDDEVGLILWALDNEQVERAAERDGPEPGHQPRVLEGARQPRCTVRR